MIEFAYAATSGAANPSGGGMSILMIVLMVAIFYFMLIRPELSLIHISEPTRP